MKVNVYWDFPDYAVSDELCHDSFAEPDNAPTSQIERDARESAFEHFDWSWEKINAYVLRVYFEYPDFVTNSENDFEDVALSGTESDDELEKLARSTISDHFEWSYETHRE